MGMTRYQVFPIQLLLILLVDMSHIRLFPLIVINLRTQKLKFIAPMPE